MLLDLIILVCSLRDECYFGCNSPATNGPHINDTQYQRCIKFSLHRARPQCPCIGAASRTQRWQRRHSSSDDRSGYCDSARSFGEFMANANRSLLRLEQSDDFISSKRHRNCRGVSHREATSELDAVT